MRTSESTPRSRAARAAASWVTVPASSQGSVVRVGDQQLERAGRHRPPLGEAHRPRAGGQLLTQVLGVVLAQRQRQQHGRSPAVETDGAEGVGAAQRQAGQPLGGEPLGVDVGRRGGVDDVLVAHPGVVGRLEGEDLVVGLPQRQVGEGGRQRGRPGVAVQLDAQRQPGLDVGPDVDATDAGLLVRGGETQPGRGATRDPLGGQPLDLVGPGALEHALGQHRRQHVGGDRQPHGGVGVERDVLRLVDPAQVHPGLVQQVGLAGRAQGRHPPGVGARPPHAQRAVAAQQLGRALEGVVGGQLDAAAAADQALVGLVVRRADRGDQLGGRQLALGHRPGARDEGRGDQERDPQSHEHPPPRGRPR